jgi:hypothetical protein
MLDIAGASLLARQLDWLRAGGCESVLVETSADDVGERVARWVKGRSGDHEVSVLCTERLVGPREVARRAGVLDAQAILAVPSDLLGDGDLGALYPTANGFGAVAFFMPPPLFARRLSGGTVRLVRAPLRYGRPAMVRGPGWGARVSSEEEAILLSAAIRADSLPRGAWPIRARERERGATLARTV